MLEERQKYKSSFESLFTYLLFTYFHASVIIFDHLSKEYNIWVSDEEMHIPCIVKHYYRHFMD